MGKELLIKGLPRHSLCPQGAPCLGGEKGMHTAVMQRERCFNGGEWRCYGNTKKLSHKRLATAFFANFRWNQLTFSSLKQQPMLVFTF